MKKEWKFTDKEDEIIIDSIRAMQKQLQTLAEAVRELAKEVHANRDFIARQGEISNKIIEAVEIINDEVY